MSRVLLLLLVTIKFFSVSQVNGQVASVSSLPLSHSSLLSLASTKQTTATRQGRTLLDDLPPPCWACDQSVGKSDPSENDDSTNSLDVESDDFTSIELKEPMVFYDDAYDRAYIQRDGLITFETPVTQQFIASNLPDAGLPPLVAPFWSHADDNRGKLFVHSTNSSSDVDLANEIVAQAGGKEFDGTAALITTWEVLAPHLETSSEDEYPRNTFQSVLVYSSTSTWVIFSYIKLEWFAPSVVVGVNYPGSDNEEDTDGFLLAYFPNDDKGIGPQDLQELMLNTNCDIPGTYAFELQKQVETQSNAAGAKFHVGFASFFTFLFSFGLALYGVIH